MFVDPPFLQRGNANQCPCNYVKVEYTVESYYIHFHPQSSTSALFCRVTCATQACTNKCYKYTGGVPAGRCSPAHCVRSRNLMRKTTGSVLLSRRMFRYLHCLPQSKDLYARTTSTLTGTVRPSVRDAGRVVHRPFEKTRSWIG